MYQIAARPSTDIVSAGPTHSGSFDYSVVDEATASSLRRNADQIRGQIRGHQRSTVRTIIATGAELIKAKAQLGHGHFGRWLQAEFRMNERSAQLYMRAAEEFGAKTETVSVLPPTTIYLLSSKSTPPTIVASVIADLEAGRDVDPNVIEGEIETARINARLERKQQRKTEARKANKRQKAKWEKERPEREREEQQRRDRAQATAQKLIDDLTLSVVRRVLDAIGDWEIRRALQALCDSES